ETTMAAVPAPPAEPPPPPLVNVGSTRLGRPELSGAKEKELLGFSGRVFLRGTPKPEIPIPFGPDCRALRTGPATTGHFVVISDGGLANVLVVVDHVNVNPFSGPPLVEPPVLTAVGCMLEPYVMGVLVGQTFQVRNIDPVLHNFHFTPKLNREVNFAIS